MTDTTTAPATVRGAVEKRASAPAQVTPKQAIRQQLENYAPVIMALLPEHISKERFVATVANACRKNPDLYKCAPDSVLAAALRAAQLGLEPNDERNLCFILPYGNKAQFQLGYGGRMELARRATEGLRFNGDVVRENDEFEEVSGSEPVLIHRKPLSNRGEAVAWYVVAFFPDGSKQWVVLDREAVEYHRSFSKQRDGQMWTKSYDAAALKSCVHELGRWLPSSPEMALALRSDERVIDLGEIQAEDDPFDTPELEEAQP
jgi:recombination protein RecT